MPSPEGPVRCGSFVPPDHRTAGGRLWSGFWPPRTAGTLPSQVRTQSSYPGRSGASPAPRSGRRGRPPTPRPPYVPLRSAARTPPATSKSSHTPLGCTDFRSAFLLEAPLGPCPPVGMGTLPAGVAWVPGASSSGPLVLHRSRTPGTSPRRLPVAGASSIADAPLLASSPLPSGPPTARCGRRPGSPGSSASQPCLARIRRLPLPAYGPLTHDYPVALCPEASQQPATLWGRPWPSPLRAPLADLLELLVTLLPLLDRLHSPHGYLSRASLQSALLADAPRQRIRILVLPSGSMDDLKIELGQSFQPAGYLPLRFAKVPQPSQRVVVCAGNEPPTVQIRSEVLSSPD
ncbi:hypothetical protein T05_16471 [Trichinella murrelli]|uniref:Uncharacterized protein n=1 Tax=Trichinella murrelli TaxID=144512 RepID=A0A0V0T9N8_9BILA|nr:hypothetical protein T05_16471 [Trichinella murrelli]